MATVAASETTHEVVVADIGSLESVEVQRGEDGGIPRNVQLEPQSHGLRTAVLHHFQIRTEDGDGAIRMLFGVTVALIHTHIDNTGNDGVRRLLGIR